jgi:hypothetical protein
VTRRLVCGGKWRKVVKINDIGGKINMCMDLFGGEIFEIRKKEKELNFMSDEQINQKYLAGEVRIVTEQARYPLTSLKSLFSGEKYNLHPEFQRRRRWSAEKRSKLIESFIINVPVPPVFLYEIDFAKFEVMDGLQRISTIIDFYDDKLTLSKLDEWPELNGKTYSQLPEKIKEGIDRRYLSSIILLKESAKSISQSDRMKKLVFERLNSGGIKLSSQETRNALYDGKLNRLCIKLSKNVTFRRLWGLTDIETFQQSLLEENESDVDIVDDETYSKRRRDLYSSMGDVELVLRFFAFRHLNSFTGNILELFLDSFLQQGNLYLDKILRKYNELFKFTIELADNLFGDLAFKQYNENRSNTKWSTDPTKTTYDPLMQILSNYFEKHFSINFSLEERTSRLEKFFKINKEILNGKKQNKSNIMGRIHVYETLISSLISYEEK